MVVVGHQAKQLAACAVSQKVVTGMGEARHEFVEYGAHVGLSPCDERGIALCQLAC